MYFSWLIFAGTALKTAWKTGPSSSAFHAHYILAILGCRRQETVFFSLKVVLNNKTWALFLDLNWWADTFYVYAKDNKYCDIYPLSSVRKQPTSSRRQHWFPREIGSLSNYDDDHNDDFKKKKKLVLWAKQQLCTRITLFSTFLWRPLHDYDVKPPNLTFYGGRGHTTTNFPLSFRTWINSRKSRLHLTYLAGPNRRD